MNNKRNTGALVGGAVLIAFGLIALVSQLFGGFQFWNFFWPVIIIAFGALFFIGMLVGGRSVAGLAIPGSIIGGIGLMLFFQNLFNRWESWSYGWTVILFLVGLGIFIMGLYAGNGGQRRSGLRVMRIGAILFVIFGTFFELIFSAGGQRGILPYIFPALLVLLGVYLVITRSGLFGSKKQDASDQPVVPAPAGMPPVDVPPVEVTQVDVPEEKK